MCLHRFRRIPRTQMSRPLARRRRFWRTMSHTRKPGNASRSGREGREVELWPRSLLTACERIYTRGHTTRCARLPRSAHKGARRTALATPSASVPPASESWQRGVQPAGDGTRRAPRGVLGLDKRVLPAGTRATTSQTYHGRRAPSSQLRSDGTRPLPPATAGVNAASVRVVCAITRRAEKLPASRRFSRAADC